MNLHSRRSFLPGIALAGILISILLVSRMIPGGMTPGQVVPGVSSPEGHGAFDDDYLLQPRAASFVLKITEEERETGDGNGQDGQQAEDKDNRDRPPPPEPPDKQGDVDSGDTRGNVDTPLGSQYVLGFYVDKEYSHPSSYDRMVKYQSHISAVAPFWYRLSPSDGSELQEHHSHEGFTEEDKKAVIGKARQQNIEVLMLVHNLLYGGRANGKELAGQMLATAESRKAFIDRVEGLIKKYNYDGINLDIENIYLEDRQNFSALVKELYQRLDPQGYKVTVCVPAKTVDNRSNTWSGPFDYKKIGKYSHRVAIMTYDEHGYSSGPGPVASYGWVRNVIKYAIKEISPRKVLMGIPGYGFDWTVGQKGPGYISYSQAINRAASKGAKILWDNTAKVPYFKYRDDKGLNHEVWFESSYSLNCKLDIAKEYKIGGIALWRIGLEDPGVWKVIEKRIKVEK